MLEVISRVANGSNEKDDLQAIANLRQNMDAIGQLQEELQKQGIPRPLEVNMAIILKDVSIRACRELWRADKCEELIKWEIQYMRHKCDDGQIVRLIAQAVGVFISVFAHMECSNLALREILGVFGGTPSMWNIGFEVCDCFVDALSAMVGARSIRMEPSEMIAGANKVYEVFGMMFAIADRFQQGGPDERSYCLKAISVCAKCLSFSEKPPSAKPLPRDKTALPAAFRPIVSDLQVLEKLFGMYGHMKVKEPLECVIALANVLPSVFEKEGDKRDKMFRTMIEKIIGMISQGIGMAEVDNRMVSARLLETIGYQLESRMIQSYEGLGDEFVKCAGEFTSRILGNPGECGDDYQIVRCLLSFWTSMYVKVRYDYNSPLKRSVVGVTGNAFFCFLAFLDAVVGRSQDGIEMVGGDVVSDSIAGHMKNLIGENADVIVPRVVDGNKEKVAEILGLVEGGNAKGAQIAQHQLALQVGILTDILCKKAVRTDDITSTRYHPYVLGCLVDVCEMTGYWIDHGQNIVAEPLEKSLLYFIEKFFSTLFVVESPKREKFYGEFAAINDGKYKSKASLSSMNEFLFGRLIMSMKCMWNDRSLLSRTIQNIKKFTPPGVVVADLVAHRDDLAFAKCEKPYDFRRNFCESITTVIMKSTVSNALMTGFLNVFDGVFARLPDPASLQELVVDLSGVFKPIKSAHFELAFQWLFPNRLEAIFNAACNARDHDVVMQDVLDFMIIVFEGKNIKFEWHSVNGVRLFKGLATWFGALFERYRREPTGKDDLSNSIQSFMRCCKMLDFVVTGGYVPFSAFEIYGDLVWVNLVRDFIATVRVLTADHEDFKLAESDPDALGIFIKFISVLCNEHMDVLMSVDPAFIPVIIDLVVVDCGDKPSIARISILDSIITAILENIDSEASAVMMSAVGDSLITATKYLWSLVFKDLRNFQGAKPLLGCLRLYPDGITMVMNAFLARAPEEARPEIIQCFDDFGKQVKNATDNGGDRDVEVLRQGLDALRKGSEKFGIKLYIL